MPEQSWRRRLLFLCCHRERTCAPRWRLQICCQCLDFSQIFVEANVFCGDFVFCLNFFRKQKTHQHYFLFTVMSIIIWFNKKRSKPNHHYVYFVEGFGSWIIINGMWWWGLLASQTECTVFVVFAEHLGKWVLGHGPVLMEAASRSSPNGWFAGETWRVMGLESSFWILYSPHTLSMKSSCSTTALRNSRSNNDQSDRRRIEQSRQ